MAQDALRSLIVIVLGCFAIGGLLLAAGSRRVDSRERRARWIKFLIYFAVVITVLGAARLGRTWLLSLILVVLVLGTLEIAGALHRARALGRSLRAPVWIAYIAIAAASILGLRTMTTEAAAFVYVVVAAFDGFSQVSGQLFGRHKLAWRISPGKTIEGTLGGACRGAGHRDADPGPGPFDARACAADRPVDLRGRAWPAISPRPGSSGARD